MNKQILVVRPEKALGIFLTGAIFFSIMTLGPIKASAASDSNRQEKVQDGKVVSGVENARRAEELEHGNKFVEASDIIGKNVTDSQKNKIGEVKDLAIDLNSGRINYVVVSAGGFLGMGDKLLAMPPQSFSLFNDGSSVATGQSLVLNISEQIIKQSPALPNANWDGSLNQQALSSMYQRAGVRMPAELAKTQKVSKASDIIGGKIITGQNEDVGKVKDLAVDFEGGRVPYAILSIGGFAGINDKVVVVPTNTLSIGDKKDKLQISSTLDQLKNSPEIDQGNWKKALENSATGAPQEPKPETLERHGK